MRHVRLDARRLLCPQPVIRTQDAMERLATGDLLEVRCTDPGALHDIPAWCRVHGHAVESMEQDAQGEIVIVVRVAHAADHADG